MRKLLAALAFMAFASALIACGPTVGEMVGETGGEVATEAAEMKPAGEVVAPAADTSTPVKLATPTPRVLPPTPTPIPPTPTPEPTDTPEPGALPTPTPAGPTPTPEPTKLPITDIMVEVPAGPFTMGSDASDPEDAPAHEVDLPAFEIDKFEVTNVDFATFVEATGYETYAKQKGFRTWRDEWGEGEDNHPVVMVNWEDALAYCEWLGKRLPTEAEWEKAARGDDGRSFPWGEGWDPNKANVKETGLRTPVTVGSFGEGASPYGVEDMVGNVWEWTADWYQPYPGNTTDDPYYGEQFRVTRGGGWFDEEPQATTFNRNAGDPQTTVNDDVGFRCAR
jgi:formylglycine-generating enzyme required for sulfatase activity